MMSVSCLLIHAVISQDPVVSKMLVIHLSEVTQGTCALCIVCRSPVYIGYPLFSSVYSCLHWWVICHCRSSCQIDRPSVLHTIVALMLAQSFFIFLVMLLDAALLLQCRVQVQSRRLSHDI